MLPSLRDWIFSAKTFAGAMLALWIALRMGLDRPYWAMATAYIVAQPLTGAMRSKAAYRFYGTLLGAVACLVFIPNFVDAPVLLIAALSLWIGGCIYFAVLDRTPRSYVFLLAGYSVALIGFPIVDAPDTVWDVVLARVEEITLGIVCTTVIGSIVFPIPLGPALTARLDNWIRDASRMDSGRPIGRSRKCHHRRGSAQSRRRCCRDRDAGNASCLRYVQFADRYCAGGNPPPADPPTAARCQWSSRSHPYPARIDGIDLSAPRSAPPHERMDPVRPQRGPVGSRCGAR